MCLWVFDSQMFYFMHGNLIMSWVFYSLVHIVPFTDIGFMAKGIFLLQVFVSHYCL